MKMWISESGMSPSKVSQEMVQLVILVYWRKIELPSSQYTYRHILIVLVFFKLLLQWSLQPQIFTIVSASIYLLRPFLYLSRPTSVQQSVSKKSVLFYWSTCRHVSVARHEDWKSVREWGAPRHFLGRTNLNWCVIVSPSYYNSGKTLRSPHWCRVLCAAWGSSLIKLHFFSWNCTLHEIVFEGKLSNHCTYTKNITIIFYSNIFYWHF